MDVHPLLTSEQLSNKRKTNSDLETSVTQLESRKLSPDDFLRLCQKYPGIQELKLNGNWFSSCDKKRSLLGDARVLRQCQALHSLRSLTVEAVSYQETEEWFGPSSLPHEASGLNDRWQSLHSLAIRHMFARAEETLVLAHDGLEELDIVESSIRKLVIQGDSLVRVSIGIYVQLELELQAPGLLHLDLMGARIYPHAAERLFSTANSCWSPNLTSLSLCSLGGANSEAALRFLSATCPNLHSLDASSASVGTFLTPTLFPRLKELTLSKGVSSDSLAALSSWPSLQVLRLKECVMERDARLSHPLLQTLSIQKCKGVEQLSIACPSLLSLDLADCPKLAHLGLSSQALKGSLVVRKVPALSSVSLNCPQLEGLELSEDEFCKAAWCRRCNPSQGCRGAPSASAPSALPSLPAVSTAPPPPPPLPRAPTPSATSPPPPAPSKISHPPSTAPPPPPPLPSLLPKHCAPPATSSSSLTLDLESCPKLMSLELQHRAFTSLSLSSPSLRSLTLASCFNVSSLSLVPAPGLSSLPSPDLFDPTAAPSSSLVSPNLQSMILSCCSSLVSLSLASPSLSCLSLKGCEMDFEQVNSAIQGCPALKTLDVKGSTMAMNWSDLQQLYPHVHVVCTSE